MYCKLVYCKKVISCQFSPLESVFSMTLRDTNLFLLIICATVGSFVLLVNSFLWLEEENGVASALLQDEKPLTPINTSQSVLNLQFCLQLYGLVFSGYHQPVNSWVVLYMMVSVLQTWLSAAILQVIYPFLVAVMLWHFMHEISKKSTDKRPYLCLTITQTSSVLRLLVGTLFTATYKECRYVV